MRSSSDNRPQMFYAQRRNTNVTPGCFLKRHFEKCRGDVRSPLSQQVLVYIFMPPPTVIVGQPRVSGSAK